eukprot:7526506-Prorocentrum_lima.AAC.1
MEGWSEVAGSCGKHNLVRIYQRHANHMPACDDIRRRGGQSHVVLSWESAEFAADPVAEPFFARLSERRLRSWERRTGEEMNHERRQAGLSTAVQP